MSPLNPLKPLDFQSVPRCQVSMSSSYGVIHRKRDRKSWMWLSPTGWGEVLRLLRFLRCLSICVRTRAHVYPTVKTVKHRKSIKYINKNNSLSLTVTLTVLLRSALSLAGSGFACLRVNKIRGFYS